MIDSHDTVIRLKWGLRNDQPREHFGTRTDVICARSHLFEQPGIRFWHSSLIENQISARYLKYGTAKPSTGLCAVFCALEYLKPKEIALIGYDLLLNPEGPNEKYNDRRPRFQSHEAMAEAKCLSELPVKVIDLVRVHGQVR